MSVDYFSGLSGLPEAHMSIGYRYLKGLGVPQSCEKAVTHYEYAANFAAEQISSRGYTLRSVQVQLTNHIPWLSDHDNEEELIQYYDRMAHEGDVRSIHTLGKLYMQGSLHTDQDLEKAASYFQIGADASHSACTGQLGLMYTRGIGVEADPERGVKYLQKASRQGDPTAILALGYCYHHGVGVDRNVSTALELYQSVANKHEEAGFYTAELILAAESTHVIERAEGSESHGKKKESQAMSVAQQFYMSSANRGHMLSMHRIGHIGMMQKNIQACAIAQNFKAVAESGDWGHKSTVAHRLYNEGDMRGALNSFSELAFEGYESAQMNAAFILSKMYCPSKLELRSDNVDALTGNSAPITPQVVQMAKKLRFVDNSEQKAAQPSLNYGGFSFGSQWTNQSWAEEPDLERTYTSMHSAHDGGFATVPHGDAVECESRALALYAHSAHQGSGTAYLKVGDYHYYGLGGLRRDKSEAARYYQIAADMKNTHALFNLGIMHQTGDGVLKDFHLAKRFYDEAAVYANAATTPSTLAVGILQLHQFLYAFFGEKRADDMLSELSSCTSRLDKFLGLGPLIFAARSQLLKAWLSINKSVLISSSSRFETDAYISASSVMDQAIAYLENYRFAIESLQFKKSTANTVTSDVADTTAETQSQTYSDYLNSDTIATLLFILSVSLFLVIFQIRAARRRRNELENAHNI